MVFSSTIFLFYFLPAVVAATFLSRSIIFQNLALLALSLFFYAWGESVYIYVILLCIGVNYIFSLMILMAGSRPTARKAALALAICANLGVLLAFKYTDFFIVSFNAMAATFGAAPLPQQDVHLPLGISFFTFQAVSYVVDVYRGEAKVQKNPLNLALYISLFPQLIAGPIVRYRDIAERIVARRASLHGFSEGSERFIIGLGKKMIIANPLGYVSDTIFSMPATDLTFGLSWLGAICYTMQIYFDFSGYSDMAIGMGKMLGFRFPENFNYPYISRSIKEFWRRWHMTLSSWFRDYLYIPLGGNKKGPGRTYFNLFLVFFLCGLWHGASWTFVIWGLYHGFFLVLERVWPRVMDRVSASPIGHLYAMAVVVVGWVIFRADSLSFAMAMLKAMAGFGAGEGLEHSLMFYLTPKIALLLPLGMLCATPFWRSLKTLHRHWPLESGGALTVRATLLFGKYALLVFVLLFSASLMAVGSHNPFIYFRF
ncbi:MAG: MBOAT family protein [Nitrospinota bacterium]|nr:MBOAT family protein [Nitrospinota bacterium]